ncbi:hypothetical protein MP228_006740 [Amoeboaphelidium protococcarum]|nr:hypothetical protein MP228_006740 [Amoeboaphelidium protococcarum]
MAETNRYIKSEVVKMINRAVDMDCYATIRFNASATGFIGQFQLERQPDITVRNVDFRECENLLYREIWDKSPEWFYWRLIRFGRLTFADLTPMFARLHLQDEMQVESEQFTVQQRPPCKFLLRVLIYGRRIGPFRGQGDSMAQAENAAVKDFIRRRDEWIYRLHEIPRRNLLRLSHYPWVLFLHEVD